jgi:hypothetical protein
MGSATLSVISRTNNNKTRREAGFFIRGRSFCRRGQAPPVQRVAAVAFDPAVRGRSIKQLEP